MTRYVLAGVIGLVSLAATAPQASAAATCATADHPGGEWRLPGRDLTNNRHQKSESKIGTQQAASLSPAWTFSAQTPEATGAGDFTGTPIVADGCVYIGSNRGWVFALNADTGELVWRTKLPRGGMIPGSTPVYDGVVYAGVTTIASSGACTENCSGPYMVGLDQQTGEILWQTDSLDDQFGAGIYSSPIVGDFSANGVKDPVVLQGVSGWGAESAEATHRYTYQGSFVMVDGKSGDTLKKTWVIMPPTEDPANEFSGASIWATPAVDAKEDVAYVPTGNPFNPVAEHEHANAVLKVGLDRTKAETFGVIVDSYKGANEEYFTHYLEQFPCVDILDPMPQPFAAAIPVSTCLDFDFDFGMSANLLRVGKRKLVGAGQKAGIYHAFDAKTMERVWTSQTGTPTPVVGGIVGPQAYDGARIFGPNSAPGYIWAASEKDGRPLWAGQLAPVAYGNASTVANGVVYSLDMKHTLNAFDAKTGVPLLARPIQLDSDSEYQFQSTQGAIAVARNTVYASIGTTGLAEGQIVAFRPGATGGGGGGGGGNPLPIPEQVSPMVVAGPGGSAAGYATRAMVMPQGVQLSFLNADLNPHDVVERNGKFSSELISGGQTTPVNGTENLAPGSYEFYCSIHPGMTGTLQVVGATARSNRKARR